MSMLPPFFRGGIVLCPPASSSPVPITPGKQPSGTAMPSAHARVDMVGDVPDLQVRLREIRLGEQAAPRADRRPAEIGGGLHLEHLDHERVAGGGAAHAHGPVSGWPRNGPRPSTSAWVESFE